jgi:hypothetical protein
LRGLLLQLLRFGLYTDDTLKLQGEVKKARTYLNEDAFNVRHIDGAPDVHDVDTGLQNFLER